VRSITAAAGRRGPMAACSDRNLGVTGYRRTAPRPSNALERGGQGRNSGS